MANTKLSGLTAASAISAGDLFYSSQSAASRAATAAQIKTFCSASPALVTPNLGVAAGTSLALGGATIGANALAVTGAGTFSGNLQAAAVGPANGGQVRFFGSGTAMQNPSDGIVTFINNNGTSFNRLQLGGTTSSFAAIKLNGTALNFRLADDSADAAITAAGATLSGVLKLGNAYVATPQVTSGYVTIQDSTGTTYKVCVAT